MYNVFSSFLSDHQFEFNLDEMKKDILDIKSKTAGRIVSNHGGWQGSSLEQIRKPFVKVFNEIDSWQQWFQQQPIHQQLRASVT